MDFSGNQAFLLAGIIVLCCGQDSDFDNFDRDVIGTQELYIYSGLELMV